MDRNVRRSTLVSAAALIAAGTAGALVLGEKTGLGPFGKLYNAVEADAHWIETSYDFRKTKGQVVFYGGAGTRDLVNLREDLKGIPVQNHGFRIRSEADLMNYAGRLVYPYEPKILVLESAPDAWKNLKGEPKEITEGVLADRKRLLETMHIVLPDLQVIVTGTLPAPGLSEKKEIAETIDAGIKAFAGENPYVTYVSLSDFTGKQLYRKDGLRLNHVGQYRLAGVLRPYLEKGMREEKEEQKEQQEKS
ncbi:MAG: hypothetical protein SOH60_01965 [Lachnospiraceae bacterium]|jgi:hypothetical protein